MTKKQGRWRTSFRCKVCNGTGKIKNPQNPSEEIACMTCTKGWITASGNVTS